MEVITVSSPAQGLSYFPFRQKLLKRSLKPAPLSPSFGSFTSL